jgi:hypothetical protein
MKLADEIVDLLSSNDGILSEALIKTKVLLHKIGHKDLVAWVNKELNGYDDNDELPDYRIVGAQVLVNASNGAYEVRSHPIPLGHLDEDYRKKLENGRMPQSLAVIEEFSNSEGGTLESSIPMEANGYLGKGLSNNYIIQRAWSEISITSVSNILMQVRSRLLDFVLELSSQFSDVETSTEIKDIARQVDAENLFNNAIFGDNTTIVVGTENTQTVTNTITKNDLESLRKTLIENGVDVNDITSLEAAISEDSDFNVVKRNEYGSSVKDWLGGMLTKAIDTSWQIELGVASSLLATALNNYYGLG